MVPDQPMTPAVYVLCAAAKLAPPASATAASAQGVEILGRTKVTNISDGTPVSVCGCYEDRYIREGGEWRFAERRYQVLRQVEGLAPH